jgi:ABC-type phosphate/phosphonate transport system permease subunit
MISVVSVVKRSPFCSELINGFEYNQAGTALWAIVIVVWPMDFLSAEVRKRVV